MYFADELRKVVEKAKAETAVEQSLADTQKALDYLKKLDDQMMELAKKGSYDVMIPNNHDLSTGYWTLTRTSRDLINQSLLERGIVFDFASKINLSWAKK